MLVEKSGLTVRRITAQRMRDFAIEAQVNIPIEQTWVWYEFEDSFPDRDLVGFFAIMDGDAPVLLVALMRVKYHGFDFIWAKNGPVWLVEPTAKLEHHMVDTLKAWIKDRSSRIAFLRMHLLFPRSDYREPAQIVSYDRTVVLDLSGTNEEIFSRYRRGTRSDIRRHRRRDPMEISDETNAAIEDFQPYYELLAETADRQGFTAWDVGVYQNLMQTLRDEHARLYCARQDGKIVAWALFTLSGAEVAYYYAASSQEGRKGGAPAQILAQAAEDFAEQGFSHIDLVGIGSDKAPSLSHLTSFKGGFAEEYTEVAPAYDVPVNKALYRMMTTVKDGKKKAIRMASKVRGKRDKRAKHDNKGKGSAPTEAVSKADE